jgi:hypothetical protein
MTRKKLFVPILLIILPLAGLYPAVVNKDKPERGEWDLKLEKVWETGRAGDKVLGLPQGMIVSDDGVLYLNDQANKEDYIFDPDGKLVRAFAKRGEGPGEVQRHGRFFLAGDKLVISDMGRIHYFTREGEYIRTVTKDCEPRAFLDENRLIDAPLSAVFLPEGRGKITVCDLRSGRDTAIAEFSAFEGGIARGSGGRPEMDIVAPLFSPLMTVGYSGDRLYWGMSDRYAIRVTDLEGRDITSFSVDRKKTKVPTRDKREYFSSDNLPPEALRQIVDSLPDDLACFVRIEVHDGLVFVYVPEMDLANKMLRIKQIDIFSPEGQYLYKARLNFGKNRTHLSSPLQNIVFKDGFLYAVLQDEEDNVLLARYKISFPTS